ncbi:NADPH-dependent assimilatory sulfite reductase hemoprotein subunit [Sulfuriroseicoccus oceanibius]|uniref:Sulfite reductase [NADPH] hemoprotein beta-component n=1 Tax=Sulfuriroseicoccus oceanibius TaxID=2707525 RepID=A0A6B3L6H4_9BACT|nr:NADPH-dependent assimilatory sulfite reductase hemoprotein subunit [Sulfuriroseicoccus oceanibius]QQL46195.1 NADPH-dependent assimilatory sulfite reductase hemoprotein subunit [Sulfuriroseicoccus oceanibius]
MATATQNEDHTRSAPVENLSKNEPLKVGSNYLKGTLIESLANASTGSISADEGQLLKFHGSYMQDDRDLRKNRRAHKLEPAYSFMIRVRVPGGVTTPEQWLAMDEISDTYANGTIKLTTRQAYQFHGVIKSNLKQTIEDINLSLLDTIAACGDVNRNVMCNPNPYQSKHHAAVLELSKQISDHLTPKTPAYHEIWLSDEAGEKFKVTQEPEPIIGDSGDEVEPIYGKTYLPRKFKIVVAVPPSNDVDIYAHDLGFIAIIEDDKLVGYNVTVGGGMGSTHGNTDTFPRLAEVLGFCTPEQAVAVAEAVVSVQRDFGDRKVRAHARLKYTIEDRGLDWFRDQVEQRLGYKLGEEREFAFEDNGDRYGWVEDEDGNWHHTLFVQGGRVLDKGDFRLRTALREIAKVHTGDFRLTANQNLQIARVTPEKKSEIEALLKEYQIDATFERTALRLNSMACVALPTCGLALAEAERYLPDLISQIDDVVEEAGLAEDAITIRMTGCPNGCARPFLAEIGFVGRGPGRYNLYLGGGFSGNRLNKLYRQDIKDSEIVDTLRPIILDYAQNRNEGERFGDFVIRKDYITATVQGSDFHANLRPDVVAK